MKILERIEEFNDPREPLVLTVGTFDGMHRGHTTLLKTMKDLAGAEGQTVVITFRNHPSEVLRPEHPVPLLCSYLQKLHLLETLNLDTTILLTFTKYLAQHNASVFIETIRKSVPFTHLVLGHDATLGRDKQGDRPTMLELADLWGFTLIYIDEYRYEAKPVSSTRIREALHQGDLMEVEALLNRPYSICAPIVQKEGKTNPEIILLDVSGLCLPPPGIYAIEASINEKLLEGTATIKSESAEKALLEVRLKGLDQQPNPPFLEIFIKTMIYNHFSNAKS